MRHPGAFDPSNEIAMLLKPTATTRSTVLRRIGIFMRAMSMLAIGLALAYLPDNRAGQRALFTICLWFGACFAVWSAIPAFFCRDH
jgi:hypothetical protein